MLVQIDFLLYKDSEFLIKLNIYVYIFSLLTFNV